MVSLKHLMGHTMQKGEKLVRINSYDVETQKAEVVTYKLQIQYVTTKQFDNIRGELEDMQQDGMMHDVWVYGVINSNHELVYFEY